INNFSLALLIHWVDPFPPVIGNFSALSDNFCHTTANSGAACPKEIGLILRGSDSDLELASMDLNWNYFTNDAEGLSGLQGPPYQYSLDENMAGTCERLLAFPNSVAMGVLLLMETFTRKRPTDEMFTGEMSLRRWVMESLPHRLREVVDANLVRDEQAFSAKKDCLISIMDLALDCCMESPDKRMHMTDVAAKLKKIKVKFLDDVAARS
ncbi:hypothetical protein CUMW_276610, partial [Citrus unshiu]